MSETRTYLQTLWPELPEGNYLLVWTHPDKTSHWCQSRSEAEFVSAKHTDGANVYLMMGTTRVNYGPFHRGTKADIAAIPGLWVDLDLKGDGRKKTALPATPEDLLSVLPPDVEPTMLVQSGGGYHAYWLFHEPFLINDAAGRDAAESLLKSWQTLIRRRAQTQGWTLDYTHDLTRVLRVPGTYNRKTETPRPVTLMKADGPRYDPEDIRELLEFNEFADRSVGLVQQSDRGEGDGWRSLPVQVAASATVDPDLIEQLCQIDPRLRATWNHDRPDIVGPDGAHSEYDLALANFGVAAGLPVQVIVNMMIEHRRRHGGRAKLRADYYQRTVWRAMHQTGLRPQAPPVQATPPPTAPPRAGERIEPPPSTGPKPQDGPNSGPRQAESDQTASGDREGAPRQESASSGRDNTYFDPQVDFRATDDAMRVRLIEQVSQWIGLRILRIVKVTGREPSYVIETEQYKIDVDCAAKFVDQGYMRARIAAVTNLLIRKHKADEWDRLVRMALGAVTEKHGGDELEIEGEITTVLQQYLASRGVAASTATVMQTRDPLVSEGRITVSTLGIMLYLKREFDRRMNTRDIAASLTAIGATSIRLRANGVDQTRWSLPAHDWNPSDYGYQEGDGE